MGTEHSPRPLLPPQLIPSPVFTELPGRDIFGGWTSALRRSGTFALKEATWCTGASGRAGVLSVPALAATRPFLALPLLLASQEFIRSPPHGVRHPAYRSR